MDLGLIGGIAGALLGIAGGVIGTYASLRRAASAAERRLVAKFALVVWLAVAIFVALPWVLPKPYGYFGWALYGILLPIGIVRFNHAQTRLRARGNGT